MAAPAANKLKQKTAPVSAAPAPLPETAESIEDKIEWKIRPEPPVAGFYHIELVPRMDTQSHDPSIDDDYRKIHTPWVDFLQIDVLEELQKLETSVQESWLRQNEQIDSRYYSEQSARRNAIKRDESNIMIGDIRDYQKYIEESFENVDKPLDGYEIVEEYPLFPSEGAPYILVSGDVAGSGVFINEGGKSTLVDRCIMDGAVYNCVKQSSKDNIIIEIKDGKAFYSFTEYLFKFDKTGS